MERSGQHKLSRQFPTLGLRLLLIALLGVGCAETQIFQDSGQICVFPGTVSEEEGAHEYRQGVPLAVVARSPGCLQTNCFEIERAECAVAVDGTVITVTSSFEIRLLDRIQCKSDCRSAEAECTSEPIESEGIFEVRFGDATTELAIPSTAPALCTEDS